ncbi:hypothetical protein SEA_COLT_98 [Mycobacterium phage Colt]|uniref:Uncharacterized protein n=1 Tax=Mycobacterium phage Cane17 TaxID=2301548 RepID=A0A346N8S2_9CAUD|nr:hypothetical protein KHO59_gp202 [Mycobacterium phage Cane17]AXQ51707.1 hypothetical protein SEA_CANE17_97 [Mycobacterium phage Cane17]QAY14042.1 hypothetical protein SEA_COLT_98 [Mycobacterium phage Colt]
MALDMEKLRAFASEVGYWPATDDDDELEARRQAHAADTGSLERTHAKYGHLREHKRQVEAEAAARRDLKD